MNIQATLSLRATAKFLAVAIFLLLALAAATALLNRTVWLSSLPSEVKSITNDIYREFSVDEEQNIPTWYSSNTLLVCAILLGLIATHKSQTQDRYRWYWAALAVIFGLLALDEFVSFHEEMNKILNLFISFQGLFYFGWVILALPAVSVLAIVYLKWWRNLPKRSRLLMMVAAFLYLGGAVGMEMLGGYAIDRYGPANRLYALFTYFEELGEMSGVATFIYALLDYIYHNLPPITISVTVRD